MSGVRQSWLVALREMRERSRSKAFRISLAVMLLVVIGVIALPSLLDSGAHTKDVGLTGVVSKQLPDAIRGQGEVVGTTLRIHDYEDLAVAEKAVRDGDVDVLIVDAQRLEWRGKTDEQLQAVVSNAIQVVAIQERATAAGISPDALLALVAPVPLDNVELGSVAGRSPDDETAAMIMTVLLFIAITTYGNLVLTGVVEEKASRVVEVLLARMPARSLLAGKVTGIGLLGLAQFTLTALVGLVTMNLVESVDIPAVRGSVLAWVVVWFVLGYALYAMVYGALGSLASRTEDAQSVAGPVIAVLIAAYFASFAVVGEPDSSFAQVISFFPVSAPMAMPVRIAMGAAAWWEPVLAAALILVVIAALVQLGGRVYARAVLHGGPALRLRDVWRGGTPAGTAV